MTAILNIDVDDVLAPFVNYSRQTWLPRNWGSNFVNLPAPTSYDLVASGWFTDSDMMQKFLDDFGNAGGYAEMPVLDPDAANVLNNLQREGSKIRVITVRGTRDTSSRQREQDDTVLWLNRHGVNPDEVLFEKDKSVFPCSVAVDDSPKHIAKYAEVGTPALMMDASHNQDVEGFRVFNWLEIDREIRKILA